MLHIPQARVLLTDIVAIKGREESLVFSSMSFLALFLPAVLVILHVCPGKARNAVLACVSLFFYAWGEPRYVLIMLFSTVFDYVNGLGIEHMQQRGKKGISFLVLSIAGNLAILGYFKYTDFAVSSLNRLAALNIPLANVALPIGISFYTFQTMSYSIDVYRRDTKAQHNIIDFCAYVTMFPQLIAGPIVRYRTIADELEASKASGALCFSSEAFGTGMQRFILGLGKKVFLANQAGAIWSAISALEAPSAATAWVGAICYTFQIYFDFSGYSDMAVGLGRMLGFTFPENFNYPYTCTSITDFWRRWHMTLGSWFREYVYIPLGGNQRGLLIQLRNILIVWMLTGLWHGAAWNFVCWGLYYGLILSVEKLFMLKLLERVPRRLRHIYTLPLIIIGWVIFASDDIGAAAAYISAMFCMDNNALADGTALFYISSCVWLLILMTIACTSIPSRIAGRLVGEGSLDTGESGRSAACAADAADCTNFVTASHEKLRAALKNVYLIAVFAMSLAFLVSSSYNPFLYFRF